MLKINFSTPVPYCQRDNLIKAFRTLGFTFDRITTNGTYQVFKFYGRLPLCRSPAKVDVISNSLFLTDFVEGFCFDNIEFTFLIERK